MPMWTGASLMVACGCIFAVVVMTVQPNGDPHLARPVGAGLERFVK